MDLYEVAGLGPLDVTQDVMGEHGPETVTRERNTANTFDVFMAPEMLVSDDGEGLKRPSASDARPAPSVVSPPPALQPSALSPRPAVPETLQQIVQRTVRAKLGQRAANSAADDRAELAQSRGSGYKGTRKSGSAFSQFHSPKAVAADTGEGAKSLPSAPASAPLAVRQPGMFRTVFRKSLADLVPSRFVAVPVAEPLQQVVQRMVRQKLGQQASNSAAEDRASMAQFSGAGSKGARRQHAAFSDFSGPSPADQATGEGTAPVQTVQQVAQRQVRQRIGRGAAEEIGIEEFAGLGSKAKDRRAHAIAEAELAVKLSQLKTDKAQADAARDAIKTSAAAAAAAAANPPAPAPAAYVPPTSFAPAVDQPLMADETTSYAAPQGGVPSVPTVSEGEMPTAPVLSEDEPSEGVEAVGFEQGSAMFGLGENFMRVKLSEAGLPKGTKPIDEDYGEQQSSVELDARFRPPMQISAAKVGLPYVAGESGPWKRNLSNSPVEILDSSVVPLDNNDIVGRYGIDRVDFLDPLKFGGMGDLGQLPTAQASAISTAQVALSGLAARESQLQQYSQPAYDSFMTTYATLRNTLNATLAAMQANPSFDMTQSLTLTAQIGLYGNALNTALANAAPKKPKAAPKPATMVAALPGAIKETVFSKYGLYVIGGGALLIAGLLVANTMMKRRAAAHA